MDAALLQDDDFRILKNKVTVKQVDELIKLLCAYCERPNCTLFCQKHCKRAFHKKCYDLVK